MYCADTADFPIQDVISALNAYRRNPANRVMPLPAQIIAILNPRTNERGASLDLANRLCTAVEKHGYTWSSYDSFQDEFLNHLGEVAWNVVQKRGGWKRFCEQYWNHDPGHFVAQLRDLIEFTWSSHRSGDINPMQKLPEPEFKQKLSLSEQAEDLVGTERFKQIVQRSGDEYV